MSRRFLLVIGTAASVILATLTLALVLLPASPSARAQTDPDPGTATTTTTNTATRHVTVVGYGEVRAEPDTAHVQIGVETEADTAQDAMEENSLKATGVISELKNLGIAERDIQTSRFNITTIYDQQGREVTGYRVSNMVAVTIRDLEQAGELLDQVVQVGANQVYGMSFTVDDPSALLEEARENAMDDAWERAEQLATAGKATLGDVLVITEQVGSTPPVPAGGGHAMPERAEAAPIQAGEQSFTMQIQVTFALE